jgi:hypothetical protein
MTQLALDFEPAPVPEGTCPRCGLRFSRGDLGPIDICPNGHHTQHGQQALEFCRQWVREKWELGGETTARLIGNAWSGATWATFGDDLGFEIKIACNPLWVLEHELGAVRTPSADGFCYDTLNVTEKRRPNGRP